MKKLITSNPVQTAAELLVIALTIIIVGFVI